MLCLGLVSCFCIEYFTSFENSIESVAVFLCLRTNQASISLKRERKFPVTSGTGAKYSNFSIEGPGGEKNEREISKACEGIFDTGR